MQQHTINSYKIVSETFPIPANCSGISRVGQTHIFWFPEDDMTPVETQAIDNAFANHTWGKFYFTDVGGGDVKVDILTDEANITPIIDGVQMPQIATTNGVATITVTPTESSFTFDVLELDTLEATYGS